MRPYLPPLLLLAVLTLFTAWSSLAVNDTAQRLAHQLEQADTLADRGDWNSARRVMTASYDDWTDVHPYIRTVHSHSAVDSAEVMYCRARAFAATEELTEFRAEVAGLRAQILQIAEAERFLPENIL